MSPRRVHRPSSQLNIPSQLRPPHGWQQGPASPLAPVRTDMSSAKIWYKFEDAAAPLVNSGTLGAGRNLPLDAVSDGPGLYHAVGIFGNALQLQTVPIRTTYLLDVDDSALFGTANSIWCWITPSSRGAGYVQFIFGADGGWWGSGAAMQFRVDSTPAHIVARCSFVTGGNNVETTSSAGAISWGVPNLIGVSYDGANVVISVNGVQVGNRAIVDLLTGANHAGWFVGCPRNQGAWHCPGLYHDAGFDNRVIGLPEFLAMYHAGVP